MYKFSVPMPFKKEQIDKLFEINNEVEKSKITSVYFALPNNCSDVSTFEQSRFSHIHKTDFEHWKPIIEYSMEKGFEFIYLLNSPKSFMVDEGSKLDTRLRKLDELLTKLRNVGCYNLRLANTQTINYIVKNYPDFKIYGSTSLEYTNIKQYDNFIKTFPKIVQMVPSWDINKNFSLLKNLRKLYPNVELELMLNEGCISGCPFRMHHNFCLSSYFISPNEINRADDLTESMYRESCRKLIISDFFEQICKSNVIYPWELEEYSKIGINNFKLAGRNEYITSGDFSPFYLYLKGVDNFDDIANEKFSVLNNEIKHQTVDVTIKEIKPYLPDIKHFIQHGHLCSSSCGVTCRYCFECAEKLNKKFSDELCFLE